MVSLIPGCLHSPLYPFRGMRMVARDADEIQFVCPACGSGHIARRCRGTIRDGRQCKLAARLDRSICGKHLKAERPSVAAGTEETA